MASVPRRLPAPYRRVLAFISDHEQVTRAFMHLASAVDPVLLRATNGWAALPLGFPVLLLRVRGARTGELRETPLLYTPDGERLLVIASRAGDRRHPAWYHNVRANPEVDVLAHGRTGAYRARELEGEERAAAWARASAMYEGYDVYQRRAGRTIPVIALERR